MTPPSLIALEHYTRIFFKLENQDSVIFHYTTSSLLDTQKFFQIAPDLSHYFANFPHHLDFLSRNRFEQTQLSNIFSPYLFPSELSFLNTETPSLSYESHFESIGVIHPMWATSEQRYLRLKSTQSIRYSDTQNQQLIQDHALAVHQQKIDCLSQQLQPIEGICIHTSDGRSSPEPAIKKAFSYFKALREKETLEQSLNSTPSPTPSGPAPRL